jgi:hypothetical protein
MRFAAAMTLAALASCMPPSVKAVDDFLAGYEAGDDARVLEVAWPNDRPILRSALEEARTDPNGPRAMLLPPRPIGHDILDILRKESDARHVVLTRITMKNPLPFAGERIGQNLEIPKTRPLERRFLSVREGERWYVKLDLAAVEARASFAEETLRMIGARRLDEAEAKLASVPAPPDDPNAQHGADRLVSDLRKEIADRRKRVKTSSTSTVP